MALTEEEIVLLVARTRRAEREEEAQRRAQEEAAGAGENEAGGRDRAIAATERSKHMSLLHDKTIAERAIHPWPNSSIRIPKDIVNLARHGVQIPLIWLTVEGLLDTSGQHRKFVTVPPTPKVQEYLAAAYEKDRFLPRGAFSQALQAFIALWNAVGPQAPAGTASQASLLEDMHLAILSHAVDEHWPIWRAYAKKVLDWIFEERAPGEGIGLNIAEIDQRLVAEAERECKYPAGRAIDFTNSDNTMVGKLLRAEGSEVARIGAEIDQLHRAATFGDIRTGDTAVSTVPPSGPRAERAPRGNLPSAGPFSWQRRDYDRGPQPFQRAPPSYHSRDGGAWPQRAYRAERDYYPARTPQFCTSCLEMVSDHDFRSCRRPYAKNLEEYNGGWRFPGKDLPFCNRYNCGGECTRGCTYVQSAFSFFRRSALQASAFAHALEQLPVSFRARLAHVVPGVNNGFSMGELAMPSRTILAPQHFSKEQAPLITAWKDKALEDGFAVGPFSGREIEDSVGPFACVPLTVVHTPATETKAEKNRVCFNASWPTNVESGSIGIRSINDELKEEEWECEWLLINEVKLLLSQAHSTACAMGFDLADAYQQLPNAPWQRRRFVFAVDGEFFVWIVGMFGIATMSALFGQLCDVLCWWIERCFPSVRARHFADDHLVLHDGTVPCPSTEEVYAEVARFGWKVHATKHFSWSRRFVLLGFDWDMDAQTVALTEEKRSKYLRKLSAVLSRPAVRYKETSSVAGTLIHSIQPTAPVIYSSGTNCAFDSRHSHGHPSGIYTPCPGDAS
ncbi:unnamed protein product [Tilletia controversa]|nr:unnamed protein product [Tilletia controversa]